MIKCYTNLQLLMSEVKSNGYMYSDDTLPKAWPGSRSCSRSMVRLGSDHTTTVVLFLLDLCSRRWNYPSNTGSTAWLIDLYQNTKIIVTFKRLWRPGNPRWAVPKQFRRSSWFCNWRYSWPELYCTTKDLDSLNKGLWANYIDRTPT